MTYKDEARSSQAGKVRRMIGSESDKADRIAADSATHVSRVDRARKIARACGGRVSGDATKPRLDKPARARGGKVGKGKTTVNVIVAPQGQGGAQPQAMPLPPAPPPIAPPAPAAPPLPPKPVGAGSPVPPVPMRQRGGRVKMDSGAGGGLGRLEKVAL